MKKRHNWGLPLLTALVTLGIWEGAVRLFDISLYILPAPSDVLMAVIENFQELMYHASVTLSEALIGLGLSALLAIILNVLIPKDKEDYAAEEAAAHMAELKAQKLAEKE